MQRCQTSSIAIGSLGIQCRFKPYKNLIPIKKGLPSSTGLHRRGPRPFGEITKLDMIPSEAGRTDPHVSPGIFFPAEKSPKQAQTVEEESAAGRQRSVGWCPSQLTEARRNTGSDGKALSSISSGNWNGAPGSDVADRSVPSKHLLQPKQAVTVKDTSGGVNSRKRDELGTTRCPCHLHRPRSALPSRTLSPPIRLPTQP